jgi:dipeptidyl aminopeptidase/acylaminoacyl peptidase
VPTRLASSSLLVTAAVVTALAFLGACAPGGTEPQPDASPTTTLPAPTTDRTLRTLIDEPTAPGVLTVQGERLGDGTPFRRLDVTYPSGDLTISGILDLPAGDGPFPVVVFVHGYQPPREYEPSTSALGMQSALVAAGYAVLATDLRNYGSSSPDPERMPDMEVGATQDVVAALCAVAAGGVPELDPDRVALVGHSQGGRISLNTAVVAPEAMDAVVALSPSSAVPWQNVEKFMQVALDPAGELGTRGNPQVQPQFWTDVTTTTFADRAHMPVLVLQGDADEVVDPAWASTTVAAWNDAGGDARLVMLPGANHALEPSFDDAMRQACAFLDEQV